MAPSRTGHRLGRGPLAAVGGYVVVLGTLAMLWFGVGLGLLLARAEGAPWWRSATGAASLLVMVSLTLAPHWEAAQYRAESLTDEWALSAFDLGNPQFANAWVALGSFALCSGWVTLDTGFAPRWTGWLAVLAGVGLVLSRVVWVTSVWFLPYAVFWIWLVAQCLRLLRDAGGSRTVTR